MLIDGLKWCRLLVDYCDAFISCLDSHSDGTRSLSWVHWWGSDVMIHFSRSVERRKENHLHLGWPVDENLSNWVNYSFKWPSGSKDLCMWTASSWLGFLFFFLYFQVSWGLRVRSHLKTFIAWKCRVLCPSVVELQCCRVKF